MKTKTLQAFIGFTGQCAIAMLGLGCAQIFGFDKTYESEGEGSGGGTVGSGEPSGGGETVVGSTTGSSATGSGAGDEAAGGGGGIGGGGIGGGGTGGGGTGGAGPCEVLEVRPGEALDLSMIDDMEDGNLQILPGDDMNPPRSGDWFMDNDGSPEGIHEPDIEADLMTSLDPPRGDSRMALHTRANDRFTAYGASVAVFLNDDDFYDASGYRGITFWARAEEGSSRRLKVMFIDRQTRPTGGICDEAAGECYDHFHRPVTLTSDWKHFKIPAECLKQGGYGKQFDAPLLDQLWGLYFSFEANQAFDIWIDDVAFYR